VKITRWGLLAIGAAGFASAACVIPVYVDEGNRWSRPVETFRHSSAFEAGGALRVDNAWGNIVIRGWERDELEVTAEETRDDSAEPAARPLVDVETGETAVAVKVRPADPSFSGERTIHLTLRVPHRVILKSVSARRGRIALADLFGEARLRLEDGDIRVENYSGALDAELGRGAVRAELVDLRDGDIVRLVLGEGPVEVFLEPGFNGRLEADAGEGPVACDFDAVPAAGRSRVSGTVGTGEGALVIASARSGSVSIRKTG